MLVLLVRYSSGEVGPKPWTCMTPYNEPGQCIHIRECPPINRLALEAPRPLTVVIMNFLRESVCGDAKYRRVCCRNQDLSLAYLNRTDPSDLMSHRNINLLDLENCGRILKGQ